MKFVLPMAEFGHDIRIEHLTSSAFTVARQRTTNIPLDAPGKDWPQGLTKRNPDLIAKRNQAPDWKRYNIYEKTEHWFDIIGKVLQRPVIDPENVYNMNETGVMFSMPGLVKVLVAKKDLRGYRGGRVKCTVVTAIECVSASGRYDVSEINDCVAGVRSNWTAFPTPGWHCACSESGYTDS